MTKLKEPSEEVKRTGRFEGVSPSDRTRVIMLSQVVAIVALIILWSVLRSRKADAA